MSTHRNKCPDLGNLLKAEAHDMIFIDESLATHHPVERASRIRSEGARCRRSDGM